MFGSVTRLYAPAGDDAVVRLGRKPFVHVAPLSLDFTQPMLVLLPPLLNRPAWTRPTIVEPQAAAAGSTSVACCAAVPVYGSVLIRVGPPDSTRAPDLAPGTPVEPVTASKARTARAIDVVRARARGATRRRAALSGRPMPCLPSCGSTRNRVPRRSRGYHRRMARSSP